MPNDRFKWTDANKRDVMSGKGTEDLGKPKSERLVQLDEKYFKAEVLRVYNQAMNSPVESNLLQGIGDIRELQTVLSNRNIVLMPNQKIHQTLAFELAVAEYVLVAEFFKLKPQEREARKQYISSVEEYLANNIECRTRLTVIKIPGGLSGLHRQYKAWQSETYLDNYTEGRAQAWQKQVAIEVFLKNYLSYDFTGNSGGQRQAYNELLRMLAVGYNKVHNDAEAYYSYKFRAQFGMMLSEYQADSVSIVGNKQPHIAPLYLFEMLGRIEELAENPDLLKVLNPDLVMSGLAEFQVKYRKIMDVNTMKKFSDCAKFIQKQLGK